MDVINIESFSVVFLSIILEAIPFLMLGTIISSIIDVFVSESFIERIIPKNKFIGLLIASLMGIIFPVCECAIVPITRRLVKKGVPIHIAITFMLAVPIVNPVVLLSTYYAFSGMEYMVLLRGGLGLLCAIIIGYFVSIFIKEGENPLRTSNTFKAHCGCCHHDHAQCKHSEHKHIHYNRIHNNVYIHPKQQSFMYKLTEVIDHTGKEIYEVGKFFITGALLSTLFKVYVPKSLMLSLGENPIYSVLAMMLLAFVLSVCSEADAFIAKTFVLQFTPGAVLGFLILGPMIDIKNVLMLAGSFKFKFTLLLVFFIFAVCFIAATMVNVFVI